ncbi:MAG: SPASM domain-containing protein [Solirubrobacteraceae bacterium]
MIDLIASPRQRQFGLDKRETLPQYCLGCDARFACHGGCPKDRFISAPDRRTRAELPLPRLQGVLPPHRRAEAHHVGPPA